MSTPDLFDWAAAARLAQEAVESKGETSRLPESVLQARFEGFHAANPRVYSTLVQLAREARAVGQATVGIGMLWEVMRWKLSLAVTTSSAFKLNNNHRSRYARLIMAQEPDLADVFETRELRA